MAQRLPRFLMVWPCGVAALGASPRAALGQRIGCTVAVAGNPLDVGLRELLQCLACFVKQRCQPLNRCLGVAAQLLHQHTVVAEHVHRG